MSREYRDLLLKAAPEEKAGRGGGMIRRGIGRALSSASLHGHAAAMSLAYRVGARRLGGKIRARGIRNFRRHLNKYGARQTPNL